MRPDAPKVAPVVLALRNLHIHHATGAAILLITSKGSTVEDCKITDVKPSIGWALSAPGLNFALQIGPSGSMKVPGPLASGPHVIRGTLIDMNTKLEEGFASLHQAGIALLGEGPDYVVEDNVVLHAEYFGIGGALVVNTCTRAQLRDGFWYSPLIPNAWAAMSARFMPLAELQTVFADELGLREVGSAVVRGATLQGDAYLDPTGPLREAWRNGDSTWSLTTPAELAAALAQVRAMVTVGTAEAFVNSRELRGTRVGQTVYVYGRR